MKEEILESARQLREDCKDYQRKTVLHAKETPTAAFQELEIGGMPMKDRLL